jgi:hypothetical protein
LRVGDRQTGGEHKREGQPDTGERGGDPIPE